MCVLIVFVFHFLLFGKTQAFNDECKLKKSKTKLETKKKTAKRRNDLLSLVFFCWTLFVWKKSRSIHSIFSAHTHTHSIQLVQWVSERMRQTNNNQTDIENTNKFFSNYKYAKHYDILCVCVYIFAKYMFFSLGLVWFEENIIWH